jgi:hypothetical protein
MRNILESSGVALAGVITSIGTAIAVTLVDRLLGINVFTFSLWVVLPAGAVGCGFLAASGYFLASKWLHQRPTKTLLVQMVAIAAFTQALIYWLEYKTMVVDGANVSDFVSFGQYLDISLTKTHMMMGRGAHIDTGEVGSFGYWLAIFQFLGFLIGGASIYFVLKNEPNCSECNKYLKTLVTKKDSFADIDDLAMYYDNEFANPVDSLEFAQHVGIEHSAGKAQQGTINMETKVLGCPSCGAQSVLEKLQIFNGSDWKDLDELNRFVAIPAGVDVVPAYS